MARIPLNAADQRQDDLLSKLDMSTAEIGLTVRTTNCLEEKGIFTVRDLLNCTPDDLLSISNFGEKTLDEVYGSLESVGFFRRSRQVSKMMVAVETAQHRTCPMEGMP